LKGETIMAADKKPKPVEEKAPVKINVSQYRSMILSKLRADIDAKRAAYEFAQTATPAGLEGMAYWKMAYWKMKYWKMGSLDPAGAVINPPPEAIQGQK
jgi:hypothetical protein